MKLTPREKELIRYIIKLKKATILHGSQFFRSKSYVKDTYERLVQGGYLKTNYVGYFYPTKKSIDIFAKQGVLL